MPSNVLAPRSAWADPSTYDDAGRKLARLFIENFETELFQPIEKTVKKKRAISAWPDF